MPEKLKLPHHRKKLIAAEDEAARVDRNNTSHLSLSVVVATLTRMHTS